jgi:hypothetical protein
LKQTEKSERIFLLPAVSSPAILVGSEVSSVSGTLSDPYTPVFAQFNIAGDENALRVTFEVDYSGVMQGFSFFYAQNGECPTQSSVAVSKPLSGFNYFTMQTVQADQPIYVALVDEKANTTNSFTISVYNVGPFLLFLSFIPSFLFFFSFNLTGFFFYFFFFFFPFNAEQIQCGAPEGMAFCNDYVNWQSTIFAQEEVETAEGGIQADLSAWGLTGDWYNN